MFTFDDVKHEKEWTAQHSTAQHSTAQHSTAHAYMATQQLEECETAHTLEEFLREPQHYVVLK
jgi:hypothetical protein